MMKKLIITGSAGQMGTVALKGLKDYSITALDLPKFDVRDYKKLPKLFNGKDMVLHFAWNTKTENWKSETIDPDNVKMAANIYRAAVEARVPRVLMASSVHADSFFEWKGPGLLSPHRIPTPQNPYGASKIFIESLGRHYAKHHGLEVICVRFAGMNRENKPPKEFLDRIRWITHGDFLSLLKVCIEAPKIPDKYCLFYGVCNHPQRLHDFSNPLGWKPKENADSLESSNIKQFSK